MPHGRRPAADRAVRAADRADVGALRHYDELDLLAAGRRRPGHRLPALPRATRSRRRRAIAALRDLEMPLDEIREVLAADDPADRGTRSCATSAPGSRPGRRGSSGAPRLGVLPPPTRPASQKGDPRADARPSPPSSTPRPTARSARPVQPRWTCIETTDRTIDQDDEMIHDRPRLALALARGRARSRTCRAASGRCSPGLLRARPRRAGPVPRPALRRDHEASGEAIEDWDSAVRVRGDGPGERRRRRPRRRRDEWKARAAAGARGDRRRRRTAQVDRAGPRDAALSCMSGCLPAVARSCDDEPT